MQPLTIIIFIFMVAPSSIGKALAVESFPRIFNPLGTSSWILQMPQIPPLPPLPKMPALTFPMPVLPTISEPASFMKLGNNFPFQPSPALPSTSTALNSKFSIPIPMSPWFASEGASSTAANSPPYPEHRNPSSEATTVEASTASTISKGLIAFDATSAKPVERTTNANVSIAATTTPSALTLETIPETSSSERPTDLKGATTNSIQRNVTAADASATEMSTTTGTTTVSSVPSGSAGPIRSAASIVLSSTTRVPMS